MAVRAPWGLQSGFVPGGMYKKEGNLVLCCHLEASKATNIIKAINQTLKWTRFYIPRLILRPLRTGVCVEAEISAGPLRQTGANANNTLQLGVFCGPLQWSLVGSISHFLTCMLRASAALLPSKNIPYTEKGWAVSLCPDTETPLRWQTTPGLSSRRTKLDTVRRSRRETHF